MYPIIYSTIIVDVSTLFWANNIDGPYIEYFLFHASEANFGRIVVQLLCAHV